jgi:23S rRNA pseudouridine1911/1915/1917 synthase
VSAAVVPPELEGPLDRAVRSLLSVSWERARDWIRAGKVTVGGVPVLEVTARVRTGDAIAFDAHARRPGRGALRASEVLHADSQIIVVAKPSGVSTVPFDASEIDTLESRVRAWLERSGQARRGRRPPLGIVHRIDKETSGLVVFARTWAAKSHLAGQFRRHSVHRRYLAIVCGELSRARTVRSWLLEDRGDGLRGSARGAHARQAPGAREAVTHVEPVEVLRGATLVACRLETGRTHQIRIHLSEAGHPVAGERVYVRRFAGPMVAADRLMLHAAELGFVHPATEREVRWEQPVPDDMRQILERLRKQEG